MTNMQVGPILIAVGICCLGTVQCGEHPDGISQVSRSQDALGNYQFSYSVANNEGEQFRKEGTDALGRVVGSYGLTHNDGTHRVVDYVADQHGFRAEVRSNEPGVAPADSADAPVIRTDHPSSPPLAVAATSDTAFGKRLGSRVAYATKAPEDSLEDDEVRVSQQRNFDDYRPLNPSAYYPNDDRSPVVSRPRPVQRPVDLPRSPRLLSRTPDTKPMDVYYPPLNPHSAIRRPATYNPRTADSDRDYYSTSTSKKPYIPPYGGFDDEPLPDPKHPGVSMTTIHGGLGSRRHLPSPAPTPSYGFQSDSDFDFPRFPPVSSGFPPVSSGFPGSVPRGRNPQFPQGPLFSPPSYEGGTPNFVLRAVPIPNGIQAVRVDPDTGRIYERLVYPLYLGPDGHPAYDRNILLHNDDVSDDDPSRDDSDSGYYDFPFPNRAAYRGARERPDDDSRRTNASVDEVNFLNKPTASDLAWVHRQLSMVEGFDNDRLSNGLSSNNDDSPFSSQLRMRHTPGLFDYRNEGGFSRSPRRGDRLRPEETSPEEKLEEVSSNVDEKVSEIEKEGN